MRRDNLRRRCDGTMTLRVIKHKYVNTSLKQLLKDLNLEVPDGWDKMDVMEQHDRFGQLLEDRPTYKPNYIWETDNGQHIIYVIR